MFEIIKNIVFFIYIIQCFISFVVFVILIQEGKFKGAQYFAGLAGIFVAPFVLGIVTAQETDIISRLLKKAKSKLDLYNFMKNKYNVTITDRMGNSISLTPEQQAAANIAIVAALGK